MRLFSELTCYLHFELVQFLNKLVLHLISTSLIYTFSHRFLFIVIPMSFETNKVKSIGGMNPVVPD